MSALGVGLEEGALGAGATRFAVGRGGLGAESADPLLTRLNTGPAALSRPRTRTRGRAIRQPCDVIDCYPLRPPISRDILLATDLTEVHMSDRNKARVGEFIDRVLTGGDIEATDDSSSATWWKRCPSQDRVRDSMVSRKR